MAQLVRLYLVLALGSACCSWLCEGQGMLGVAVEEILARRRALHGDMTVHMRAMVPSTCPTVANSFKGTLEYISGAKPMANPGGGAVGCVDKPLSGLSPGSQVGAHIYGTNEAGFSAGAICTAQQAIPGGIDTKTAESIVRYQCNKADTWGLLDSCGGHATPYHYHERMTCLYTQDSTSGHSTRIGTANDGRGIYGKFVNGSVLPTDLDACNGRSGVTPDSGGLTVYYYVVNERYVR
jgi:hypothetical protein